MSEQKELKDDIQENTDLTADYMEQINRSFSRMLKTPTEKEIEKHRKERDALIALWLASLFKDFENQLYDYAQKGIDTADRQLKAKGLTKIKDKSITAETFENQVKTRFTSASEDIILTSQNIKANSERVINELSVDKINKISAETAAEIQKSGVDYFYDRAGRKWEIGNYIRMRVQTDLVNSERYAILTRAIQKGVDLVRIRHLGLGEHEPCRLCVPFENKVLSVRGKTPGYMTIDEAAMAGLFHPNCDHIGDDIELAPEVKDKDKDIKLNEANLNRYEYNGKRKGIKEEDLNKKISELKENYLINNQVSFKSLFSDANKFAKEMLAKEPNINKAIKLARNTISKEILNKFYDAGKLNNEQMKMLGTKISDIRFSMDSMIKNIIKHPELKIGDYQKIVQIIKNPDKIKPSKSSILILKKYDKKYQVVVKATAKKTENFLTSFRFAEH